MSSLVQPIDNDFTTLCMTYDKLYVKTGVGGILDPLHDRAQP